MLHPWGIALLSACRLLMLNYALRTFTKPLKGCSFLHDLSTAQQQLVLLASCKQQQAPIDQVVL